MSKKERPLGSTEGEDYIQSILLLLFRFLFMREFRKYIYLFRSHKDNPKTMKSWKSGNNKLYTVKILYVKMKMRAVAVYICVKQGQIANLRNVKINPTINWELPLKLEPTAII